MKKSSDSRVGAQAVLNEINAARADPQQFAVYLEEYRKRFNGSRVRREDGMMEVTVEGAAVVDEAIAFLKAISPRKPFLMAEGLVKAAELQLNDVIINPRLGHTGADGSAFDQRIRRFGATKGVLGENIVFNAPDARKIVMMWIIDDGVASRLHRMNLFNPDYTKVGIALAKERGGGICVITFAANFSEKQEIKAIEIF